METEYAIQVKEVTKVYKLFDSNVARMKDALSLTRKKLYRFQRLQRLQKM